MKYIDEYRNAEIVEKIIEKIRDNTSDQQINLMEVCGGHTHAICQFGMKEMLPDNVNLISGPGCPVCVTPVSYIDRAIKMARKKDVVINTFGDMLKVPGTNSSLKKEKSKQNNINICYTPSEALQNAAHNRDKEIIFLGIGFETTAPAVAQTIRVAKQEKVDNFYVFSAHKTMPEAMEALLKNEEVKIDGFICPGHVSTITGIKIYEFIPEKYGIPCVISGFEPIDILKTINSLVEQIKDGSSRVENQYKRSVKENGNQKARKVMYEVFSKTDSIWRGLGTIPQSGLKIATEYKEYDAARYFDVTITDEKKNNGCICGAIMRGINSPLDCELFSKKCTPKNPIGPCMVSSEGPCAAFYKYKVS